MGKTEELRAMREAQSAPTENIDTSDIPEAGVEFFKKAKILEPETSESVPKAKKRKGFVEPLVPPRTRTGRPPSSESHLTNEAQKPWEAQGISRRTWYRLRSKKRGERKSKPARSAAGPVT